MVKNQAEVNLYGREYYYYVRDTLKEYNKNYDRHTAWIDKVLANPSQHFEVVVKFAKEAQKRLGRKKHD